MRALVLAVLVACGGGESPDLYRCACTRICEDATTTCSADNEADSDADAVAASTDTCEASCATGSGECTCDCAMHDELGPANC